MNDMRLSGRGSEPEPRQAGGDDDFAQSLDATENLKEKKPSDDRRDLDLKDLKKNDKEGGQGKPFGDGLLGLFSDHKGKKNLQQKGFGQGQMLGAGLDKKGMLGADKKGMLDADKKGMLGADKKGASDTGWKSRASNENPQDGLQGLLDQGGFFNPGGVAAQGTGGEAKLQGLSGVTGTKGARSAMLHANSGQAQGALNKESAYSPGLSRLETGDSTLMGMGAGGQQNLAGPAIAVPYHEMAAPVNVAIPPSATSPVPSAAALSAGSPSTILAAQAEKPRQYKVTYKGKVYTCEVYGTYRCDLREMKAA